MSPKNFRKILIATMLASAAAASIALSNLRPEVVQRAEPLAVPLVDVLEVYPMTTRFTVRSQGSVTPVIETILSAEVSGTIVEMSPAFAAGGLFAPGDVLIRIDPTDYRAAVNQAEALVHQRSIEFEGIGKLKEKGYRAESDLAASAAALAAAEADLLRSRRNLERTEIRLPYQGLVRSKSADLGQFVAPGTPLGVVFATDSAEVRLPLTDQDLALLELPGPADSNRDGEIPVRLTAIQRGRPQSWDAVIVRQEGVIDERSRVTYAVARIDDPYALASQGPALPVGSFVQASISGREVSGLGQVPLGAVHDADRVLWLNEDQQLAVNRVNIVAENAEFAYIDLAEIPYRRVVLTPLSAPSDGMALRIEPDAGAHHVAANAGDAP